MVWHNRSDPLATFAANEDDEDMARRRNFSDDIWSAQTRYDLGLPLFIRLEIPLTHKSDMVKFADMVKGLGEKMEQEGLNLNQTEHGAALMLRVYVDHANRQMKAKANLLKTGRRRKSNEVD